MEYENEIVILIPFSLFLIYILPLPVLILSMAIIYFLKEIS